MAHLVRNPGLPPLNCPVQTLGLLLVTDGDEPNYKNRLHHEIKESDRDLAIAPAALAVLNLLSWANPTRGDFTICAVFQVKTGGWLAQLVRAPALQAPNR